jgi:hypothetical protein
LIINKVISLDLLIRSLIKISDTDKMNVIPGTQPNPFIAPIPTLPVMPMAIPQINPNCFNSYSDLQKAALCFAMISIFVVALVLLSKVPKLNILQRIPVISGTSSYHNLLYVFLVFTVGLMISLFFSYSQSCSCTTDFNKKTPTDQAALSFNMILFVILLLVVFVRLFKPISAGSRFNFVNMIAGNSSEYERSMFHVGLYVFVLFCNLFSISFFIC